MKLANLNPVRIREVLVNLLANALRHTPEGGVVRIGATSDPGSGTTVRFTLPTERYNPRP